MTYYLAVEWHHDYDDEPVEIVSEITDAGVEIRKLERYRDGHVDFADRARTTGSTLLSETFMPSLEEINDQPEFRGIEISPEEFASRWRAATGDR